MLLRRITQHLQAQNWFAVFLGFLIVVFGVFIGIQVANWNESRIEKEREEILLVAARQDIKDHLEEMAVSKRTYIEIKKFGKTAFQTLNSTQSCTVDCWEKLVAMFQASQWVDVKYNRETYDELLRSGLPRDQDVKLKLSKYHTMIEQSLIVIAQLPMYRERIRAVIPNDVQDEMWANCWQVKGRQQTLNAKCSSDISNEQAAEIINAIKKNDDIIGYLNFWLSTVSVVLRTIPDQEAEAQKAIEIIDTYLATRH